MPRSRYVDAFNHDEDAAGYDADVSDEASPIRAGYSALLAWVAGGAHGRVLDLGTGTGNLLQRIDADAAVAVDASANMLALAQVKPWRMPVEWVQDDLLAYLDGAAPGTFDTVVSTYALHHLTDDEKDLALTAMGRALRPGGLLAIGDLMFEGREAREAVLETLRRDGHHEAAEAAEEEFFWDLGRAERTLAGLGFEVETRRFSLLSFGIRARGSAAPRPPM